MPRLTTSRYLAAHQSLRNWWLGNLRSFACLTAREQWLLHDFFQPSQDLTESELLRHRKRISAQRPSLPQQAGKALAKFESRVLVYLEVLEALRQAPLAKRKRGTPPNLHFESVVKPAPDLTKVAIAMVRHFVAEERKRQEREASAAQSADDHTGAPDRPSQADTDQAA